MTESLIEKLEAAKLQPILAHNYDTGWNAGFGKAIDIIRQHDTELRQGEIPVIHEDAAFRKIKAALIGFVRPDEESMAANGVINQLRPYLRTTEPAIGEAPKRIVYKDGKIVGCEPNPNHQPVVMTKEEAIAYMRARLILGNPIHEEIFSAGYKAGQSDALEREISALEQRVINAACGVVAADTYKHPIMSREDAVKAGVAELHDAVNAYHSAQPAVSAKIEGDQPGVD